MNITVILCTYNRCQSLARALQSVAISQMPASVTWQVLVVDNNSNDRTKEVINEFASRYPQRFRYLFVSQPGKSNALNAGIREAQSEVLAFMDDDVTVEPTWLHELTASLFAGEWVGSGGRIIAAWTCPPPRWLSAEGSQSSLWATLACFDLGDKPKDLLEAPFGTNMAFKKEMFRKYGNFRADLGPIPGSEIRNEDTEFGHRLLAAGERLRYEPSAVVHHDVPVNRLRKEYFLAWWFDKGRADIRQFGVPVNTNWRVMGIPLYLFRRLGVWTVRWMITLNPPQRFNCKVNVWGKMGEILECYRKPMQPSNYKNAVGRT